MRTKTTVIAVLAALAVFTTATVVLAQEGGGMRQGNFNTGVSLTTTSTGYKSSTAGSSTTTQTNTVLVLSPGYYIAPEHEAGGLVMLLMTKSSGGGGSSDTEASVTFIRPFYRYHFVNVSPLAVPYAGVQLGSLGIKAGTATITGTSYGLSGGLDYFLKENVSANLELTYDAGKLSGAGADLDQTTTALSLGYKFFF